MHVQYVCVCLSNFTIWSIHSFLFHWIVTRFERERERERQIVGRWWFYYMSILKRIESGTVCSLVRQNKPIEISRRTKDENYNHSNSNKNHLDKKRRRRRKRKNAWEQRRQQHHRRRRRYICAFFLFFFFFVLVAVLLFLQENASDNYISNLRKDDIFFFDQYRWEWEQYPVYIDVFCQPLNDI